MNKTLTILATTLLAACGGGGESSSSKPTSPEVGGQQHKLSIVFDQKGIESPIEVIETQSEQSTLMSGGIYTFAQTISHDQRFEIDVTSIFPSAACSASPSSGVIDKPTTVEILCKDTIVYGSHPDIVGISQLSKQSVELTWKPVAGQDVIYNVYTVPIDQANAPYARNPIMTVTGNRTTKAIIKDLDTSRQYTYSVEAVTGNSSVFSDETSYMTHPEPTLSGKDYLKASDLSTRYAFEYDESNETVHVTPLHKDADVDDLLGKAILLDENLIEGLYVPGIQLESIENQRNARSLYVTFKVIKLGVDYFIKEVRYEINHRFSDGEEQGPALKGISGSISASRPEMAYDYLVTGIVDYVDGKLTNNTRLEMTGTTSVTSNFEFKAKFDGSSKNKFEREWFDLKPKKVRFMIGAVPVYLEFSGKTYSSAELKVGGSFELLYARTMGMNFNSDFSANMRNGEYISSFNTGSRPTDMPMTGINVQGKAGISANMYAADFVVGLYKIINLTQTLGMGLDTAFSTSIHGTDSLSVDDFTVEGKVNCATGVSINHSDIKADKNWCDKPEFTKVLHKQATLKVNGQPATIAANTPFALTLSITDDKHTTVDTSSIRWQASSPSILIEQADQQTATFTAREEGHYQVSVHVDHMEFGETLRKIHQFDIQVEPNPCPSDSDIRWDLPMVYEGRIDKEANGDFCHVAVYSEPESDMLDTQEFLRFDLQYQMGLLEKLTEYSPRNTKVRYEEHKKAFSPALNADDTYMAMQEQYSPEGDLSAIYNYTSVLENGYLNHSLHGPYREIDTYNDGGVDGEYKTVYADDGRHFAILVGTKTKRYQNDESTFVSTMVFAEEGSQCENGAIYEKRISWESDRQYIISGENSRDYSEFEYHLRPEGGCEQENLTLSRLESNNSSNVMHFEMVRNDNNRVVGSLPTLEIWSSINEDGNKVEIRNEFMHVKHSHRPINLMVADNNTRNIVDESSENKIYYTAYIPNSLSERFNKEGALSSVYKSINKDGQAGEQHILYTELEDIRHLSDWETTGIGVAQKLFDFDPSSKFGVTGYTSIQGAVSDFDSEPYIYSSSPYIVDLENSHGEHVYYLEHGTERWFIDHTNNCGTLEHVNGKRHGVYRVEYPCTSADGQFMDFGEGGFTDDRKQGPWKETSYHNDGTLATKNTGSYEADKQHGVWLLDVFFNNGSKSQTSKGTFKHGQQDGSWTFEKFYENGRRSERETGSYKSGVRQGKWDERGYSTGGRLTVKGEGSYTNDEKHGTWTYKSYTDGELTTVTTCRYDKGSTVYCKDK